MYLLYYIATAPRSTASWSLATGSIRPFDPNLLPEMGIDSRSTCGHCSTLRSRIQNLESLDSQRRHNHRRIVHGDDFGTIAVEREANSYALGTDGMELPVSQIHETPTM